MTDILQPRFTVRRLPPRRPRRRIAGTALVVLFVIAGCAAPPPDPPRDRSTPSMTEGLRDSASPALASALVVETASPTLATPAPPRESFAMDLYREGDFVAQYTFEWCVGASLQMALNMATPANDTTRVTQQRLWTMAQERSDSPFGGANPRGWTAALNDLGIGPYQLVSVPTLDEALRVAAGAIRATERPVGLVMWHGRHAWVMSGFESVGDPRLFEDPTITGIRVLDPLYPHGSTAWGPSPRPDALVSPETLAAQFVIRDGSHRVNLGVPPGYLLVLPVADG